MLNFSVEAARWFLLLAGDNKDWQFFLFFDAPIRLHCFSFFDKKSPPPSLPLREKSPNR
jgi:hypothetical protein